jgi:hypothetical protein
MPKEIAGQAMLGGDVQGSDNPVGQIIFRSSAKDPVLGAVARENAKYVSADNSGGTTNSGEKAPVKDERGRTKKILDGFGDGIKVAAGAIADAAGYVKDSVVAGWHGLTNSPGDLRVKLNKKPYYSGSDASYFVVLKDQGIIKNMYFGAGGRKEKSALLPTKISFTTLGVGGFTIGRALRLPNIPWIDDSKGYWQVTDVAQKIDSSKWEVTVELRFRVKTT